MTRRQVLFAARPQLSVEGYIWTQHASFQEENLPDVLDDMCQTFRKAGFRNIELGTTFFIHLKNLLEGHRRLTFMTLDADIAAVSPSSGGASSPTGCWVQQLVKRAPPVASESR